MRILCVCRAGQVRSVTLAHLLNSWGHEATACGIKHEEAIKAGGVLADRIYVVDFPTAVLRKVYSLLPKEQHSKVACFPVGKDEWLVPHHPDLIAKISQMFQSMRKRVYQEELVAWLNQIVGSNYHLPSVACERLEKLAEKAKERLEELRGG